MQIPSKSGRSIVRQHYTKVQSAQRQTREIEETRTKWWRRSLCGLVILLLAGAVVGALLVTRRGSSDPAPFSGTGLAQDPNNQPLQGANATHSNSSSSSSSSTGVSQPSSSSSSTAPDESSSSTGADAFPFDPSVLQYAARFTGDVDRDTGMMLPERNQFVDTPCALRSGSSACVMDIIVVFGEASSDNSAGATRFASQLKSYHLNANFEIVPYDFTSNLYGQFGGVQTVSPLLDEYFTHADNEFKQILVINALHSNTSQSDSEAWLPAGYRFERLVNATQAALRVTAPGSSVVATLLHLPTRVASSELETVDSAFLATNAIAALRQAVLARNDSALVLVRLPADLERRVLRASLYTASQNIVNATVQNAVTSTLPENVLYMPLHGDLRAESTLPNLSVRYQDDDANLLDPVFAQDDPAYGRYTALRVSRQSPASLRVSADGTPSDAIDGDPYYTHTGGSTAWQVIFPSYAVGVWVKRVDANSAFENGTILSTSGQSFENQSPDPTDGSINLRMRLLDATTVQVGHMPRDIFETQDPRGLTYTTNGTELVQQRAWTHLLMSFDARPEQNLLRLYVNGTLASERTVVGWNGPVGSFFLGGEPGIRQQGAAISGICNLRIWNKPLDDNQALQAFALDEWQLPSTIA